MRSALSQGVRELKTAFSIRTCGKRKAQQTAFVGDKIDVKLVLFGYKIFGGLRTSPIDLQKQNINFSYVTTAYCHSHKKFLSSM
jgi:hypothetical protein